MGAIVGVLLGYYFGVKAGPGGLEDLQAAWKTISTSEEVKVLLTGGLAAMRDVARRGGTLLAGRLADSGDPFASAA